MDKKLARPATAPTQGQKASETKKKKAPQILTYKDYMVREEKQNAWLSKQNLTPKTSSLNFLKTTASSRPQTATATDSFQFKKNVEQKFQNFIQKKDVISENDSLLQDSQQSRDKQEKKLILEQQKQKRKIAAQEKKRIELEKTQKIKDGLEELNRKVRQNIKNQAKRDRKSKSREKSRQRSMQERNAELVKKHAPDRSETKIGGAAAQLKDLKSWIEEQMHSNGIDDSNLESSSRSERKQSKKKEDSAYGTALSLKEVGVKTDDQKLKMLKHQLPGNHLLSEKEESKLGSRQNRYGVYGQNEFDKVVEIQREKSVPQKVEQEQKPIISQADQKQSKDHLRDLIMQLAQKSGIDIQKSKQQQPPKEQKKAAPQPTDDLSEDSCDKIPVKQTDKPISKASFTIKAKESDKIKDKLPGVTDTKKQQDQLEKERKEKEQKAVIVIQKFLRGHWGRREAAKKLYKRQNEIDEEYARFQQEYKSEQGYNLKQYLKDKQKIRAKHGLYSIDQIEEVINESSSTATAHIVQSSVQVQNFFKFGQQTTEYDPLSLISIYAKKHAKISETQKQRPVQSVAKQIKKSGKQSKVIQSSSLIEEDIYSENFDNDIPEDIQKISSSASSVPKQKKQISSKVIESVSIADEAPSAALSKSDSIVDEVGVATREDSNKESSIQEDSIIREEYESDNYKLSNAKKQLEARTRVTYSLKTDNLKNVSEDRQKILLEVEELKRSEKIKKENLVSSLLTQMREFESAALSQTLVDRMEKIVTSSLAQKDQIIMAQRLAELERENRHKEEINRIREEQIHLLSQLMLQNNQAITSQAQREEILNSIRSISQQPVVIREQPVFDYYQTQAQVMPLTHQQLYQQNKRTKITYLDEYDQSKRSSKFSSGKYSETKEDLPSKKKQNIEDLNDQIVDEVGSIKSESIAEEIEQSLEKSSSGSFEEFKNRQYKLAISNKVILSTYISDVEKAIIRHKEQKEQVLTSHLRLKKISPRSYQRKRNDLEEWASREKREVREQHQTLQRIVQEVESAKLIEQKSNLKRPLLEESNDSDQVKKAFYQQNLLEKGIIGVSPDQRYIQRKKEAAEQLKQEKEKVIQEQLNTKILNLEKERAEEVLQKALEIDVEKEVERRFQAVKKQLEESQGVESARSGVSQSRDSGTKPKKVVKFQDQDNQQFNKNQIESSNNIEESIEEAITNSYSQSFKSSSAIDSKSKSLPIQQQSMKTDSKVAPPPQQKQVSPSKSKINIEESIPEMISDNYTDDFSNSEKVSSDGKNNNFSESKSRLQNKARDLADSAAYSEDVFEEESIGQSQSIGGLQQMPLQQQNKRMDSVIEESIDESAVRSKTSSKMESTNQFQQSEVQSDDQEVHGSHQSVDWQIQVPQESVRTGQDLSDRSIREDSSLNSRVEPDNEFESNPDEIGASVGQSTSDDIYLRADFIAQDLLEQILKDYKEDNSYIVSCEKKQIDEENFKDKFPFTLEIKQAEQEIRPPSLQLQNPQSSRVSNQKPVKKVKTAREIQDENYLQKYRQEQENLRQLQQRAIEFLDFLIQRIDVQNLIETLDKPIERNLLAELARIMDYEDTTDQVPRIDVLSDKPPVLTKTFFQNVQNQYELLQRQNQGQRVRQGAAELEQEKLIRFHNFSLFEALNEVLQQKRLYKDKGEPVPWSTTTRVARKTTTHEEAATILAEARQKVIEWSATGAGSKYAPLPPPPTQTQDEFGEEIVQPPLQEGEEDRRNQHRQEKLGQLMTHDIQETDQIWTDYEIEDAQVRFDLADMILADLASEIADFLRQ